MGLWRANSAVCLLFIVSGLHFAQGFDVNDCIQWYQPQNAFPYFIITKECSFEATFNISLGNIKLDEDHYIDLRFLNSILGGEDISTETAIKFRIGDCAFDINVFLDKSMEGINSGHYIIQPSSVSSTLEKSIPIREYSKTQRCKLVEYNETTNLYTLRYAQEVISGGGHLIGDLTNGVFYADGNISIVPGSIKHLAPSIQFLKENCDGPWIKCANPWLLAGLFMCTSGALICIVVIALILGRCIFDHSPAYLMKEEMESPGKESLKNFESMEKQKSPLAPPEPFDEQVA